MQIQLILLNNLTPKIRNPRNVSANFDALRHTQRITLHRHKGNRMNNAD